MATPTSVRTDTGSMSARRARRAPPRPPFDRPLFSESRRSMGILWRLGCGSEPERETGCRRGGAKVFGGRSGGFGCHSEWADGRVRAPATRRRGRGRYGVLGSGVSFVRDGQEYRQGGRCDGGGQLVPGEDRRKRSGVLLVEGKEHLADAEPAIVTGWTHGGTGAIPA